MNPKRLEEIEQAWGINQNSPGLKQHPSYVERQAQVEELIAAYRAAIRSNSELKRRILDVYEFEGK